VIRLFSSWYDEPNELRRAEYLACLCANLDCKAIDSIHLLVEGGEQALPDSAKIERRAIQVRPLYSDFGKWIGELAAADDISIIANSDIAFDESISLAEMTLGRDECYALARWEGKDLFDRNDSQDAWVFRGKLRPMRNDFPVGVPRCDNRLLHELRSAGYRVRNPAYAIKGTHVHAGQRTEYATGGESSWVAPPYEYLWPHNLLPLPKILLHNAAHPRSTIAWRIDPRAKVLTFPARLARRLGRAIGVGSAGT
jgi:hypothetical protein